MQRLPAEVIDKLRSRGLLEPFSEAECHAILHHAVARPFGRGEVIFSRGAPADEIGWLIQGKARLLLHGAGGAREALRLEPGDAAGFIAFLASARHLVSVQALEPSVVLLLGREHFEAARRRRDAIFARLQVALAVGAFTRVALLEQALARSEG
jgi:CRP-like cAMP-binding protein